MVSVQVVTLVVVVCTMLPSPLIAVPHSPVCSSSTVSVIPKELGHLMS